MSARPRVSIVIPAFQSQDRIGPTLGRLGRQTLADFEVVVVDDGSTDATAATVRRHMERDPRIRLVEQDNRGIAAARNRGIEAAHGDVLAFLDDDDLWLPRKLELQLARMRAVPGAAAVSCLSALVDGDGRLLGWRFGGETEGDVYREMLEWDMVSGGSVAIVARGPLEQAGGFDVALSERADWDLWIRLARRHDLACVPQVLVGYTRRAGSASSDNERMLAEGRAVLVKARRDDPAISDAGHRALLARDRFGIACLCLVDGRLAQAWPLLGGALRRGPRMVLGRPRRWGAIAMLTLASALPDRVYERALGAMSRRAFGLDRGAPFDSLG